MGRYSPPQLRFSWRALVSVRPGALTQWVKPALAVWHPPPQRARVLAVRKEEVVGI